MRKNKTYYIYYLKYMGCLRLAKIEAKTKKEAWAIFKTYNKYIKKCYTIITTQLVYKQDYILIDFTYIKLD